MSELANPYIAGAPVVESSMFFGREDVFNWIERSLAGKFVGHILVIHGQRRVGKTSVLKQIPNFLPNHYIQVFFDLQGRTSTSLDRFLWWLASEITRTVKKERGIDLPRPDRAAFEDPEYLIGEFLPLLRQQLSGQNLILTFDEFDTLDKPEIQETLAKPLIAYLRRMMEVDGLNFIFSIGSSGDKLENMQASYTDFFKTALYRKISFLTRDDCHRLITKPVEGTIEYDRKAVDRIAEITSGHPYFTQLMCHELFALCQKTGARVISAENVESVLGDVIERGTVNLKFVWDEASDLEKWILAGLAQLGEDSPNHKLGQLLQNQRVRFSDSDLNAAIIHLRDKDILTESNRFVIHLMRMWLLANRPLDRVREELAEDNPIANRYIEIGDEYRDRGQTSQATDSYRQALKADPANMRAQTSIAQIFFDAKDYLQAISSFEQAIQMDDEDVGARTGFCNALLAQGDLEQASGQAEEALHSYERILNTNPAHRDACSRLARIYTQRAEDLLKAGQDDAALSAFNKALDYTPDDRSLIERYDQVLANKKTQIISNLMDKAERAVARQKWEEATGFIEEALRLDPQDSDLQAKLHKTKDAPRQFKIQAYRQEAELAFKRKNFAKAIESIETALQLSPADKELTLWLGHLRDGQREEQYLLIADQLKRSIAAEDWNATMAAIQKGKMTAPDAMNWDEKLNEIRSAQRNAELKELRGKVEVALKAEDWESAINALKKLDEIEPGQTALADQIANIQDQKYKSELRSLKNQAQKSAAAEKWDGAIKLWEEYLGHQPEDAEEATAELRRAKEQATIASEYQTAMQHIHAKHYDRAIVLLQGIIAKDPTYKSTSRLLVEAVEARKAVPPSKWLKFVLWAFGGAFLLAAIGFGIFWLVSNPIVITKTTTTPTTTGIPAGSETDLNGSETGSVAAPFSNLDPALQAIMLMIQTQTPEFETDFDDWDLVGQVRDADITNGTMRLAGYTDTGAHFGLPNYSSNNFAIEFNLGLGQDTSEEGICVLESVYPVLSPEPDTRGVSLEFHPSEERLVLSKYDPSIGGHARVAESPIDPSLNHQIVMIVEGDQISVVLDGELAFNVQNPAEKMEYDSYTLSAYDQAHCDYTSFKYWDLREIDQQVKNAILTASNQGGYYETNFSSWDFESFPENVMLEDEQLVIRSSNDRHQSTELRNLTAESFMVEFDLENVGSDLGSSCGYTVSNTPNDSDPNQRLTSLHFFTNGVGAVAFTEHQSAQPEEMVQTRVENFSFDPNRVNRVSQVFLKDQITTFVNGELINTIKDPSGEYLYLHQMFFAHAPKEIECRVDNYKIWDLSPSDLYNIRPALEWARDNEPDFMTTFDEPDLNTDPGPVRGEDGKLIVTSDQLYVNYFPTTMDTQTFGVSFDYKVREADLLGHCGFGVENLLEGESFRSVGVAMNQSGSVSVGHFEYPDKYPDLAIQPGAADGTGTNRVALFIYADKISVFVNHKLVISSSNPDSGTVFKRLNLSANYSATCEFDNFVFWDLSDVPSPDSNMDEPIGNIQFFDEVLNSINGREPSYADDLNSPLSGWANNQILSDGVIGYSDGGYSISNNDQSQCIGAELPDNPEFSDFVLEMDLTFLNSNGGTFMISFWNTDSDHYAADIHVSGIVGFHKNISKIHIPLIGTEAFASERFGNDPKHLTLVVKHGRMAIFIDGQLISALQDSSLSTGRINFGVCDGDTQKILIDNLEIWNLNDIQG